MAERAREREREREREGGVLQSHSSRLWEGANGGGAEQDGFHGDDAGMMLLY